MLCCTINYFRTTIHRILINSEEQKHERAREFIFYTLEGEELKEEGVQVNEFDDHFVCVTRTKLRFDLWLFLLSSVGLYILLRSPVLLSQFPKKARLWWHDREVSSWRNNFPATDMEPSCCIIALNLIWNCNLRRFSSFSVSCVPAFVSLSLWPRILAKLSSAYSAGSATSFRCRSQKLFSSVVGLNS